MALTFLRKFTPDWVQKMFAKWREIFELECVLETNTINIILNLKLKRLIDTFG